MSPNIHASHVYNDGNALSECHMVVVKITSTNTRKPCSPLPGLVCSMAAFSGLLPSLYVGRQSRARFRGNVPLSPFLLQQDGDVLTH